MSFGFPTLPLMLQSCFDSSIYLTMFHTNHCQKVDVGYTSVNTGGDYSINKSQDMSFTALKELEQTRPRNLTMKDVKQIQMTKFDNTMDNFQNDLFRFTEMEFKSETTRKCTNLIFRTGAIVIILMFTLV